MLEVCRSASERWGGVSVLIDDWLMERKELLILYCALTGADNEDSDDEVGSRVSLDDQLRQLCQILVDYVSAGHFEIYEQLQREALEFEDNATLTTMEPVFGRIQKNTEACLSFNDKSETLGNICSLHREMSSLGEVLAERFELEDKLIEQMHYRYEKRALAEA